eukprot:gene31810-39295_t
MGYVLGKAEGQGKLWHGHVTAVTVSPEYRRLGVATNLMAFLEDVLGYYSGQEDAYDMRKALRRDVFKESIIPLPHPITPDQLEW